ncbi:MAG: hypothetical protein M3137_00490 [Actinomycetota bacterium]|nr:hypothetical protein [Actinomycetota bacterium]
MRTVGLLPSLDMEPITVDIEKLLAATNELEAAEKSAENLLAMAQADLDEVRMHRRNLAEAIDTLRAFAVNGANERPPKSLPPGPLTGLSGSAAADKFVTMKPGGTMKLVAIYEEMLKLGYVGTLNSVSVAFANMFKADKVVRVKRGTYLFPTEESTVVPFPTASTGGG